MSVIPKRDPAKRAARYVRCAAHAVLLCHFLWTPHPVSAASVTLLLFYAATVATLLHPRYHIGCLFALSLLLPALYVVRHPDAYFGAHIGAGVGYAFLVFALALVHALFVATDDVHDRPSKETLALDIISAIGLCAFLAWTHRPDGTEVFLTGVVQDYWFAGLGVVLIGIIVFVASGFE